MITHQHQEQQPTLGMYSMGGYPQQPPAMGGYSNASTGGYPGPMQEQQHLQQKQQRQQPMGGFPGQLPPQQENQPQYQQQQQVSHSLVTHARDNA